MSKIKLGQKIKYTSTIERKSEYRQINQTNPYKTKFKFWKETGFEGEGIIVGQRTLSNGKSEYDSEAGNIYDGQEYFIAYLIAYNLNRKPLIVKKENVIIK